ncbi:hypothetical protein ACJJIX_00515 [Microbulbifer sp. VAAC004]|uniref:hypothetical protein n=1 Tax=unclassified Microbulbifer TaxID=2619833 RepID=UPI00403A73CD
MSSLTLYRVDSGRRYWVVRSGNGGIYNPHFRKYSIVAIGHADEVELSGKLGNVANPRKGLSAEEKEIIGNGCHNRMLSSKKMTGSQIGNVYGQIKRFLHEIQINDIVITVDSHHVMAGRVLSDVYYDENHMIIGGDDPSERRSICEYKLRRKVVWGSKQYKDAVPFVLANSLRNSSTVFEVSSGTKASILNHWLTPLHIKGDTLHLSSRIEAKRAIGNRPVTRFSSILDQLEILSKNISDCLESGENISVDKFEIYKNKICDYEYVLTTQQAFMSPGDHFIQLSGRECQLKVFALLFASLFGVSVVFADDGLNDISEKDRREISLISAKINESENFDEVKGELELKLKGQDKKVLNAKRDIDDIFPKIEKAETVPI